MKEIPILMSTEMVQAILQGRKTMTRREIKPQPIDNTEEDGNFFEGNHKGYVKVDGHPNWRDQFVHEFCRYEVGDLLWVREKFCWSANKSFIFYAADKKYPDGNGGLVARPVDYEKGEGHSWSGTKWKPSIHLPKTRSRIWLEVRDVKMERLHDITADDAGDEGVEFWNVDAEAFEGGELVADYKNYTWTEKLEADPNYEDRWFPTFANAVYSFRSLWQSINGMDSWEKNPWVWVIQFKVLSTTGKHLAVVEETTEA